MIRGYNQVSITILAKCLASRLPPELYRQNLNFFHFLGEVKTAQLEFLGHTIPDQAFSEQKPRYVLYSISISVL